MGIGAVQCGDGGPVGRPTPVDVPSGACGKQGQRYDLDCTDQHTKHSWLWREGYGFQEQEDLKSDESNDSNDAYLIIIWKSHSD